MATKSKSARKTKSTSRHRAKSHRQESDKKWSSKVKTVSTYPPQGLYTKDAETIARVMATKKVSPKGIGSAVRMVQFFINRAGHTLSASRKKELEKAKTLLQERRKENRSKPSND
jgi:tRNA(adenine34) deaminase